MNDQNMQRIVIEEQSKIISQLYGEIKSLHARLEVARLDGRYWLNLQKHILKNEGLMEAWTEFCALASLIDEDFDQVEKAK